MPKKKLNLLDIFKDYNPVQLSNGQIRCKCPFRDRHADGSGRMSFFISPNINAYHCFSCGAKGNLVQLLTNHFGIGFFDAMEMVRVVDYTPQKKVFDLDIMWDINNLPTEFVKRGYSEKTLKHFKVGTDDSGATIIPYYTDFGNLETLVGYQKRWYIDNDRRVLNSKNFDKVNYLYNLDYSYKYTILCEGQSDVWRIYQHGYNATALMGSVLSDAQVEMLSKFKIVYLALDNDLTGRKATEMCYAKLHNKVDIFLIPYTTKDPGDCKSKKAWNEALRNKTDYLGYTLEMTMNMDGYLEMRDDVLRNLKLKR